MIDSKALNRPLNPLWRTNSHTVGVDQMNTNSTELPVNLWDRGVKGCLRKLFKTSVYSYMMYVFGVEIKRLSVALNRNTFYELFA